MVVTIADTRPAALSISRTCIYKSVGELCNIAIDLYFPAPQPGGTHPVMLFIHGGGWLGANKSDYCRPLFLEFLRAGFVVASMDYRLRPETTLEGQLSDVRDVESWLRRSLAAETRPAGVEVDGEKIVVVGCSAGAHLALLTVCPLFLFLLLLLLPYSFLGNVSRIGS